MLLALDDARAGDEKKIASADADIVDLEGSGQLMILFYRQGRRDRREPLSNVFLGDFGVLGGYLSFSNLLRPVEHFHFRGCFFRAPLEARFVSCTHKGSKQRMRLERLRFEFRVELAADEVRMIGKFDHLNVSSIGR